MKRFLQLFRQTSLGLVLLITALTFTIIFSQAYADTSNSSSNTSYIHTGSVTTNGIITNQVNTNILQVGCGCTPTPTAGISATPTPSVQAATSTPMSSAAAGSPGGSTSGGTSVPSPAGSSILEASTSPTQAVLGLSSTAGIESTTYLFYVAGFVCLIFAAKLAKPIGKVQ